jgi:hypothetical protein
MRSDVKRNMIVTRASISNGWVEVTPMPKMQANYRLKLLLRASQNVQKSLLKSQSIMLTIPGRYRYYIEISPQSF